MSRPFLDLALGLALGAGVLTSATVSADPVFPRVQGVASSADLDRTHGLGTDPEGDGTADKSHHITNNTTTNYNTHRNTNGSNGVSGSAFSGASGIVNSIQNLGDHVVIHNITTVTVNVR